MSYKFSFKLSSGDNKTFKDIILSVIRFIFLIALEKYYAMNKLIYLECLHK